MSDFDELLKIQKRIEKKLKEEKNIDDSIEIIGLFNELAPNPTDRVQKETLVIEAQIRGINTSNIDLIIDKLIKDRFLYVPLHGYLQRR